MSAASSLLAWCWDSRMPFDRRAFESEIGMHRMGSAGNGGIRKVLYAFSTSRKMPQMLEANRSWVSTEQASHHQQAEPLKPQFLECVQKLRFRV